MDSGFCSLTAACHWNQTSGLMFLFVESLLWRVAFSRLIFTRTVTCVETKDIFLPGCHDSDRPCRPRHLRLRCHRHRQDGRLHVARARAAAVPTSRRRVHSRAPARANQRTRRSSFSGWIIFLSWCCRHHFSSDDFFQVKLGCQIQSSNLLGYYLGATTFARLFSLRPKAKGSKNLTVNVEVVLL